MPDKLGQFLGQKHINLETYRKNGQAVQTPVWFAISDDVIYVVTREATGKVKRLKNNLQVRVVPCSFSGHPTGQWVSASAELASPEESQKAIALRKKKYGLLASFAGIVTSAKGKLVVYKITIQ